MLLCICWRNIRWNKWNKRKEANQNERETKMNCGKQIFKHENRIGNEQEQIHAHPLEFAVTALISTRNFG